MNLEKEFAMVDFRSQVEKKLLLHKFLDKIGHVEDKETLKTFREIVLSKDQCTSKILLIRVVRQLNNFSLLFAKNLICTYYDTILNYYKNNSSKQNCTCEICGEVVKKSEAIEGVYADNGENYNWTCMSCHNKG